MNTNRGEKHYTNSGFFTMHGSLKPLRRGLMDIRRLNNAKAGVRKLKIRLVAYLTTFMTIAGCIIICEDWGIISHSYRYRADLIFVSYLICVSALAYGYTIHEQIKLKIDYFKFLSHEELWGDLDRTWF